MDLAEIKSEYESLRSQQEFLESKWNELKNVVDEKEDELLMKLEDELPYALNDSDKKFLKNINVFGIEDKIGLHVTFILDNLEFEYQYEEDLFEISISSFHSGSITITDKLISALKQQIKHIIKEM